MKLKILLILGLIALVASTMYAVNSFPKNTTLDETQKVQLIPGQQEEYEKIQPME